MAAMQGRSIKEFVMGRQLPTDKNEDEAWLELKTFLLGRIEQAQSDALSDKPLCKLPRKSWTPLADEEATLSAEQCRRGRRS